MYMNPNNIQCHVGFVFGEAFDNQAQTLRHLDLSHNRLDYADNKQYRRLSNLTYLDLSHNRLKNLWPKAFAGLIALRVSWVETVRVLCL